MKKIHTKTFFYVACVCFISLGVGSLWLLKTYISYRTGHPPTTYADSTDEKIDGLVFHWNFDQLNNGITPDAGPHNISGQTKYYFENNPLTTLIYGQPKVVKGRIDNALQFNGKQWISAGNKNIYNSEKFTISSWVWQENEDIYMPTIISKSSWRDNDDGYDGWWLCTTPGKRFVDMGIAWGNGKAHIKSGYQLPLKEWHHVAITMDNVNHEAQFYIDGKPYGKKHRNIHKWLQNWNHDLFVAGYDGSKRWPWAGKLDEVRFYSGVLTKEQIHFIFNNSNI